MGHVYILTSSFICCSLLSWILHWRISVFLTYYIVPIVPVNSVTNVYLM